MREPKPGTAAPQCGKQNDKGEEGHSPQKAEGPHAAKGRSRATIARAALGCGGPRSRAGRGAAVPGTGQAGVQQSQRQAWYSRGYLPHFDSSHVVQHITYRLADSLPRGVLEQMRMEVETSVPDKELRQAGLRQRIETYLDAGHGSCVLQVPEVAICVVDTWHRFDGERYRLLAWVVMPNHCHVLIEPFDNVPLGKIVLSWKNYTARFINEYKSRAETDRRIPTTPSREGWMASNAEVRTRAGGSSAQGRSGERRSQVDSQVWQREYWDRFIRNEHHFEVATDYIVMNPVKAGLAAEAGDWPWSSASYWGKGTG